MHYACFISKTSFKHNFSKAILLKHSTGCPPSVGRGLFKLQLGGAGLKLVPRGLISRRTWPLVAAFFPSCFVALAALLLSLFFIPELCNSFCACFFVRPLLFCLFHDWWLECPLEKSNQHSEKRLTCWTCGMSGF